MHSNLESKVGRVIVAASESGSLPKSMDWTPGDFFSDFEDEESMQELIVFLGYLAADRGKIPSADMLSRALCAFLAMGEEEDMEQRMGLFVRLLLASTIMHRKDAPQPQLASKAASSSVPPPSLRTSTTLDSPVSRSSRVASVASVASSVLTSASAAASAVVGAASAGMARVARVWARKSPPEVVDVREGPVRDESGSVVGVWEGGKFRQRLRGGCPPADKHARPPDEDGEECVERRVRSESEGRREAPPGFSSLSRVFVSSPPVAVPAAITVRPSAPLLPLPAVAPQSMSHVLPRVPFRPTFFVYCSSFMLCSVVRPLCLSSDLF